MPLALMLVMSVLWALSEARNEGPGYATGAIVGFMLMAGIALGLRSRRQGEVLDGRDTVVDENLFLRSTALLVGDEAWGEVGPNAQMMETARRIVAAWPDASPDDVTGQELRDLRTYFAERADAGSAGD